MMQLAKDIAKAGGAAAKPKLAAVEKKKPDVSGSVKKQITILKLRK